MRDFFHKILYRIKGYLSEHAAGAYFFWYIGVMIIFPFMLAVSGKAAIVFLILMFFYTVVLTTYL